MQQLVIIGAGYTGKRLARRAIEAGREVVGTTRSDETIDDLKAIGARALRWDVQSDDPLALVEQIEPGAWVVYSIPTLYREYEPGDGETPRHVEPVRRVLDACEETEASRFVYISSTSAYGDHGGAWVTEDDACDPISPVGKMRRDIEDFVLSRSDGLDHYVCRSVGIYGPGRTLANYIESGRYKLVDGGKKRSNRVHVDDLVSVIMAILERAPSGPRVYDACDGNPRRVAELVDFVCERLDIERPEEVTMEEYAAERGPNVAARWKETILCRGDRAQTELGVGFEHKDVIEGYRSIYDES